MNDILNRLKKNQQVFILRRSAGFSYSFLSLLRSEPANCKATLLIKAMNCLLETVETGLSDTDHQDVDDVDNQERWKLAVHSLNVLRLIFCDAALGPDLNMYLARATELAVIGFKSPRWAIRNSSMMVFTSVVQRAIDFDKNSSGGSSAASSSEYFQRYPTLFPFLLNELASITGYEVVCNDNDDPCSIRQIQESDDTEIHPTLYPLLLLLSKFRSTINFDQDDTNFSDYSKIKLFLPLLESCLGKRVHQVRTMASKAFAAILPLDDVSDELVDIFEVLIRNLKSDSIVSSNKIHGTLCLTYELITNLFKAIKRMGVEGSTVGYQLVKNLKSSIRLLLIDLITSLKDLKCPPIHVIILNLLKLVGSLFPDIEMETIIQKECANVKESFGDFYSRTVMLPVEPLMWKEVVKIQIVKEISEYDDIKTVSLHYLSSIVSEVREGVIAGCVDALDKSDIHKTFFFHSDYLMNVLLGRCSLEKEPPILHMTLDLICR